MIERCMVLAGRIRLELSELERIVARTERAVAASQRHSKDEDQDLYLDAAALNLHDFYAGLERIFFQIASTIDGNVPAGPEWHRDLLRQMSIALQDIRPPVLTIQTTKALEEYLGFRHVVRNIYTFQFDPIRIGGLTQRLGKAFKQTQTDLLTFAEFLEILSNNKK